jgi:hypothetical protein
MSDHRSSRWRNRHPAAFVLLGELVGLPALVMGVIVYMKSGEFAEGHPEAKVGYALAIVGGLLMVAFLLWGLVTLGARVFRRDHPARPASPVAADLPAAKPSRPARGSRPVPKVRLLMLGDSGAGKTTMLAGLHYQFNLSGETGIKLVTNPETERYLDGLIDVIRDPGKDYFSLGTRAADMRRYEFDVRVEWEGRSATACTLECLDYPGGWVERKYREDGTGNEEPPSQEFENALQTADILMVVLDGEKIARLMNGTADWGVVRSFENLVKILDRKGKQDIYLVVTKWDLLPVASGGPYPLRRVLASLEAVSAQFRGFRQSGRLASMRIIPVAALGTNGFAGADPAGGGMVKYPGKPWQPWNVESPFFFALPDILTRDLGRTDGRLLGKVAALTARVLSATELHVGVREIAEVTVPAGKLLVELWQRVHESSKQGRKAAADSDDRALVYFLGQCGGLLKKFDNDHPDSMVRPVQ